jgi:uncharacterized protein (DUF2141 family)
MNMSSPRAFLALLWLAAASSPVMAQGSGDASACGEPGSAHVRVHVTGFKNGEGTVRVQTYGSNPQDFLATGKWIGRVEVPLQGRRSLDVCLRLPRYGEYAIAVRHDANANGKSDWNDGGGFSRNPRLSLFHLKPDYADVAVSVSHDMPAVPIVMNYRQGLSIRPLQDAAAR